MKRVEQNLKNDIKAYGRNSEGTKVKLVRGGIYQTAGSRRKHKQMQRM